MSARVAAAQPIAPAAITGRIIDATGHPVHNAVVSVEGSPATATTDALGRYAIASVTPGASIVVLADGYGAGLGTATTESVDDIVLTSDRTATETIEVHGDPPPQALGAATVARTELERLPGTGNDLMRAVSAMPGVASFPLPLGSSGVVIRGASPQDSKVLIDDFEVPALYHNLGARSIIPTEAIDTVEYVPGGFDVAFGHATSGIVSLTTRAGSDKRGQQFETSSADGGVLAQGAFHHGHYMLAFRRSTIDLLMPMMLPDGIDLALTTVPRYYDEQFRIDYALTPRWNLRVSSLGSDDAFELYTSRDRNSDKRFLESNRFARLTTSAHYHDGPWTAKLALSGIAQEQRLERGIEQHTAVTSPAITARAEVMRTWQELGGLANVGWRVGGETVVTHHTIDLAMPTESREGEPPTNGDPMELTQRFVGHVDTTNLAAWSTFGAALDARVSFTAGLRVDAYTRAADVAVQPRGEIQIKLHPKLVARISAGAYSRPAEYQTELLDPTLRAERSRQLIGGVSYEPREGMRLQSSLYYTDRSELITRAMDGVIGNGGRGTTYGGELLGTVKRGRWFGWLTYAYSHSTRVDNPGDGSRLFDYDQPHNLNAAASYQRGDWMFGARFQLHSGLPITPVVGATFDSDANVYYPSYGPVNSERAPLHHQLDIRIDRVSRWHGLRITQFLDVQNVYLNDTVVGYFHGFDYTQRAAFHTLPILPIAGLRGEF